MFETSFFINGFNKLFHALSVVFQNSLFGKAILAICCGLKKAFDRSYLVGLLRKPSSNRYHEESLFYRGLDQVINFVPMLLKRLYKRFEPTFSNSLFFKLIMIIAQNVSVVIALFMVAVFVIPHQTAHLKWDNMYSAIAAIFCFLLFLLNTMKEKDLRFQVKPFSVFFYAFALMVVVGQIFSVEPSLSFRFFVFYMACFIFVFLMVSSIRSRDQLSTFIELMLVGVSISGLYGIYQGIKGVPIIAAQIDYTLNEGAPGRIYSTFDNPNNFAQVLAMMLPFYVAVFLNAKGVKKKIIFALAALPPLISLLLTLSRSSWIGLAVAAFVFLFLTNKKLIPMFIVLGLLALPFMPSYILTRLSTIFMPQDTSTSYRFDIFKTVWPMIQDFNLYGIGLGNDVVSQINQNYPIYSTKVPIHAHNLYLQIWAEMGLIALTAFILFLGKIFKACFIKVATFRTDKEMSYYLAAGAASLAGVLVTALAEYVWFYPRVMLVFWMVVGLVLAALLIAKDSQASEVTK